jgi:hypothetical protein
MKKKEADFKQEHSKFVPRKWTSASPFKKEDPSHNQRTEYSTANLKYGKGETFID